MRPKIKNTWLYWKKASYVSHSWLKHTFDLEPIEVTWENTGPFLGLRVVYSRMCRWNKSRTLLTKYLEHILMFFFPSPLSTSPFYSKYSREPLFCGQHRIDCYPGEGSAGTPLHTDRIHLYFRPKEKGGFALFLRVWHSNSFSDFHGQYWGPTRREFGPRVQVQGKDEL